MVSLLRLDSVASSLASAYREANDDQRRRAALAACIVAVAQSGLQGGEVDSALGVLRNEGCEQSELRHKLDHLAAQLDEQYFNLSDETDTITTEALATFRKARAAAALAFALSSEPGQLHEALYEAVAASSDQPEVLRAAAKALRAR